MNNNWQELNVSHCDFLSPIVCTLCKKWMLYADLSRHFIEVHGNIYIPCRAFRCKKCKKEYFVDAKDATKYLANATKKCSHVPVTFFYNDYFDDRHIFTYNGNGTVDKITISSSTK